MKEFPVRTFKGKNMDPLYAISPVDGRYWKHTKELAEFFSESALIKYRLIVETEYLLFLSEHPHIGLREFAPAEREYLRSLQQISPADEEEIKNSEEKINHDVKAIEYYIRSRLSRTSLNDTAEWVHFALTSEDINSIAYGRMIADSLNLVLLPRMAQLTNTIDSFARRYKSLPMLSRTHGQPASPTTFGKEFNVFSARLKKQLVFLQKFEIEVKFNGSTGNYNAHHAAYPTIDWLRFTRDFIERLNTRTGIRLCPNLITTQIEPHDTYAELFDCMRRINTILIDFTQDVWRYISDGWLVQHAHPNEIGSSTMPHKINPIDFENAEGNLGLANALFTFFSLKLPISRLQRDLSDSTVERNFGVVFAHCLIGYSSCIRGLEKITVDKAKIAENLEKYPEVVAEALQIILRKEGVSSAYETLKNLTRGKKIIAADFQEFIDGMSLPPSLKEELKRITSANYTGLAEKLAGDDFRR